MTKRLHDESTKAIRLRNVQTIFGYFAEQRMNKERWETEPANLAAYTAVDVLIDYCLSRDKHCQDCVFNHFVPEQGYITCGLYEEPAAWNRVRNGDEKK